MFGNAVSTTPTGDAEYTTSRKQVGKANGTAECSNVDITRTKNGGFSVRCSYKQTNDAKRDAPAPYVDPDTYAFSTFDELISYLRSEFGAAESSPEGDVSTEQAGATAQA